MKMLLYFAFMLSAMSNISYAGVPWCPSCSVAATDPTGAATPAPASADTGDTAPASDTQ